MATYNENILCQKKEVVSAKNWDKTVMATCIINWENMGQPKMKTNHEHMRTLIDSVTSETYKIKCVARWICQIL